MIPDELEKAIIKAKTEDKVSNSMYIMILTVIISM